jgi:hypothetical protein
VGLQALSEKNTKKWAKRTGLPIRRINSGGGYTHYFTMDAGYGTHHHGELDIKTGEWRLIPDDQVFGHFSSCYEMFLDARPIRHP